MSAILENWKKGFGFPDVLVIDGHIHIGEWRHRETFSSINEAVRESNTYLDANGVDAFCAVSGGYTFSNTDYTIGNDFLLKAWRKMPERLIPFLSVNPNDRKDNILAELDRMHGEGVHCIKLINSYQFNYPGDGPNLIAVYEYAARHKMLVFNHHWEEREILKISNLFPSCDFIFAHYGGGWQDDAMIKQKNVYANIWSVASIGWLEMGIKNVGADKFMLGSDGFLNPMSVGIGPVVFADITDEEKRLILGLNVARLLDKTGALPDALKKKHRISQ